MKLPQAAGNKRDLPVTPTLRRAVLEQVTDLFAGQDTRNYVEVVSKRLQLPVTLVSKIMAGLILEYQRAAAMLGVGLENARAQAREAANEVWREIGT